MEAGHDPNASVVLMQKTAKPQVLVYLLMLALEALARPFWASTRYVGGDCTAVEALLAAAYGELQVLDTRWFWRKTG